MVDILRQVYEEIYGSLLKDGKMQNLDELALRLSELVRRDKPWTGVYLNNLLKGYEGFRVSEDLEKALNALAATLDDQSPLVALIRPIQAYAVNGLNDGVIILGHAVRCRYCSVEFVPVVHNQKHCSDSCRKKYRRLRK